jgi:hypothetical protein
LPFLPARLNTWSASCRPSVSTKPRLMSEAALRICGCGSAGLESGDSSRSCGSGGDNPSVCSADMVRSPLRILAIDLREVDVAGPVTVHRADSLRDLRPLRTPHTSGVKSLFGAQMHADRSPAEASEVCILYTEPCNFCVPRPCRGGAVLHANHRSSDCDTVAPRSSRDRKLGVRPRRRRRMSFDDRAPPSSGHFA